MFIGAFIWESGSVNDNIRSLLIAKGISYRNTFSGAIMVMLNGTYTPVQYRFFDKDVCEVFVPTT